MAAGFLIAAGFIFGDWLTRIVLVTVAVALWWRFLRMKLSVTPTSVRVVNYWSQAELDIDTVEISDGTEGRKGLRGLRPVWLSDAGGKYDTTARLLTLRDASGTEIHVGLAPVYGSRLDRIADDLRRAIAEMR